MLAIIRIFILWACCNSVWAATPLPADDVFQLSVQQNNPQQVMLTWKIVSGYYLYRDRLSFRCVGKKDDKCVAPTLPPAKQISDALVGNYAVYEHQVAVPVQLSQDTQSVQVTYQGCSAEGFCYPPISKVVPIATLKVAILASAAPSATASEFQLLNEGKWWWVLASFLGLGILLGFTPCIFPMIPILSSILIGQTQQISRNRTVKLAMTYVLSMAGTYAVAGMLAGWFGSYVQAFFQAPWLLVLASIILVLLAFSLFGFYELQLPASLRTWLAHHHHRQKGGTYLGVVMMGCFATLIVSPCVSPPLVAALGYISTTGNMYLGGAALFMLGFGMGLPLLILLTVGSRYLPKSGRWMRAIKALCGGLLLVVAVSLLVRVFPGPLNNFFGIFSVNSSEVVFKPIKTIASLEKALSDAKQQGKPVLVDFYADWCITCKKIEKYTFQDAQVLPILKKMVLLRIDVTANDADDKAIMRKFNVIAPPTILLFDPLGNETQRIIGDIGPKELLKQIK
jgi:thioredoxin:protein disulfide reductase